MEVLRMDQLNDQVGFSQHCAVAAMIIKEFGITPHTKYHIRGAIREATKKVTSRKGNGKDIAQYVSNRAIDQVRKGNTRELILEHVVPVSYINELVLKLDEPRAEDIEYIVLNWTLFSVITKSEHDRLENLKLGKSMPTNWDNKSKFARYIAAGIELQFTEYRELKKSLEKV